MFKDWNLSKQVHSYLAMYFQNTDSYNYTYTVIQVFYD